MGLMVTIDITLISLLYKGFMIATKKLDGFSNIE